MRAYRLHGLTVSYFTRKVGAYLDYKGIPQVLRHCYGVTPEAGTAGFPGGIPFLETPDGEYMWDSTSIIEHFEHQRPEPSVFPPDPVARFLDYVIDDAVDEWYYRAAVGSRWHFAENYKVGGWGIAREFCTRTPLPGDQAFALTEAHMHATLPPLGVTPENVQTWMDDVLRPWLRATGAHLETRPFLFGARPSLGDFGLFGGNAAHFTHDPLCHRWVDEDGPAIVVHTNRLLESPDQTFGDWDAEISPTLLAIVREIGRTYLPWVSRACVEGEADAVFGDGTRVRIRATDFLREARGILLARYRAARSAKLDAVLESAGVIGWFAPYVEHAREIPDYRPLPQPALNRPFPPPGE
jgi:glutathione S-transferase